MQSEYASTLLIGRPSNPNGLSRPTECNDHWQGASRPRKRVARRCCACTLH